MIIDVNACLGHYPFRRLRFNTAPTLIDLMDRSGITHAVISSLHAAFYRDAHRGNEELFEAARAHPRRLIPIAIANPAYVGWQRDLAESVEQWKSKAVMLVPEHHGYSLTDERGTAVLARIAEYGVPVVLMQRYEDRRQRHHWDRAEDLTAATLFEVAKRHPTLKFLLINWGALDGRKLVDAGLKGRVLLDFTRLHVMMRKEVPKLIETIGIESIAFGSHMPFDYVGPTLVKLANLEQRLPAADFEKVAWRNAAAFLRFEV